MAMKIDTLMLKPGDTIPHGIGIISATYEEGKIYLITAEVVPDEGGDDGRGRV